jgi:hypothetical protein
MRRAVFSVALGLVAQPLALGPARAQPLPPSPAALSEAAVPVRVVCVAESAAAFLGDAGFRERVLARLPTALPAASGSDPAQRLASLVTPLGTPQGGVSSCRWAAASWSTRHGATWSATGMW